MIVIDAGVAVAALTGGVEPSELGDEEIAVPHLLDSEVLNVLRRLLRHDILTARRAELARSGLGELILRRYPAARLHARIWELRENLTAYDATYVALAESLEASALLTTDRRLSRAPGVRCPVRVL